jgi:hypothetical protein
LGVNVGFGVLVGLSVRVGVGVNVIAGFVFVLVGSIVLVAVGGGLVHVIVGVTAGGLGWIQPRKSKMIAITIRMMPKMIRSILNMRPPHG